MLTGTDWIFRGRKSFRGVGERKADVAVHGPEMLDALRH